MANPSAQTPTGPPASRGSSSRVMAGTLWDITWFPLILLFGFCLCYALPFHAPAPHDLKVAVAGPVNASEISAGLQQEAAAPFTPLSSGISAGTSSVTVPAGEGTSYRPGEQVGLYGAPGSSEQGQSQSLTIASVTPGQGVGGGDLITFTGPVNSAYTQISSTGCSTWFCNYPTSAGAYITPSSTGPPPVANGGFDVIPVQDQSQAEQEVTDQAAQAAYVVTGGKATLYTAGADGPLTQLAVIRAFSGISQQQNLDQSVIDLAPAAPGDPTATGAFWLSYAWNAVPVALAMALARGQRRPRRLSRAGALGVIVGAGAFASIVGFLIGYGLGVVPGQSLAILFAFLNFEAVALVTYGLARVAGRYAIGLAVILFLFLSIPSSGGPVPYQMVPTFFDWLHPVLPLGNLIDALRSIFYFNGTNMTRPSLVLCAWIVAGAALVVASARVERGHRRAPDGPGAPGAGAVTGTRAGDAGVLGADAGRAVSAIGNGRVADPAASALPGAARGRADASSVEGSGPAAADASGLPGAAHAPVEPTFVEAPAVAPVPAANGADGIGSRPPMHFGRVTDAAGGPIAGASVTIIGQDGRQVLRTSTERHGRYAADSLPEGLLTVLAAPADRMPVANQVTLSRDLPTRQDFVIPGSTDGIGSWPA